MTITKYNFRNWGKERYPNALPLKIWTNPELIEGAAQTQLQNMSSMPFIYKHIAVMPDVHLGKGATVGSVIATIGAIMPAAVGVDIGCGMLAVETNLNARDLPDNLKDLRLAIEERVPVGRAEHKYDKLGKKLDVDDLTVYTKIIGRTDSNKIGKQIGTLGGGNHFIEICLDENNQVWLMLHSGSRGVGNLVAQYHINEAKGIMREMFIDRNIPDQDLAYFVEGSPAFKSYINDLLWCQEYAKLNRQKMFEIIWEQLKVTFPNIKLINKVISCHHNYAQMEEHFGENVWITRKGAINAGINQLGIIPGSMGTKSYIVRGLGNPDSFNSASHGAGRLMSRTKAAANFNIQDLIEQTKGVECRKDINVIDEIPKAYKNIEEVMENQSDLVEIVHTLKQVLCIKG